MIFEFHRNRALAIKLKQAGNIDGIEIVHASSATLSTIHESATFQDQDQVRGRDQEQFTHAKGGLVVDTCTGERIALKNKLYDSLPSMEWSQAVKKLTSTSQKRRTRRRPYPHEPVSIELVRKSLDRRNGQETCEEAFEQLHILSDIADEWNEERDCEHERQSDDRDDGHSRDRSADNEQRVLSARGSQLRRRIYKLQRDSDSFLQ